MINLESFARAAAKFKRAELELGRMVLPAIGDGEKMNKLAVLAGLRTSTLMDLALMAAGLRKRHRSTPRSPQQRRAA